MQQTADYINEKKRQSEQLQKLFDVDQAMSGNFPAGAFVVPGRLWLKEGSLQLLRIAKASPHGPSKWPAASKDASKPVYFHLFTDLLVLSIPKLKGRYRFVMGFALTNLHVQEVCCLLV
jgi:hypothetical protein